MLVSPNNSFKPTPSSVPLSAAGSGAILHSTGRGRRGLTQSLGRTGQRMAIVYKSKIDLWLGGALAVAIIASTYAAWTTLATPSPTTWAIAIFTVSVGAGLPLWLLLSTRYTLRQGELTVRSGPFRWRIKVADISSITPTSNPLSSPALSLDRLRIEYSRNKSLLISPRDKEQFIRDIEAARSGAA